MMNASLRKVVLFVALLNLAYFGLEFYVARRVGSVSLFADSIDFLEDTSLNVLIALALGWSSIHRARLGMVLAGVLLVPGLATLWTVWQKVHNPLPPSGPVLSMTALGAMTVNLCCALLLSSYREHGGSLVRAAFLSSRNDVLANVAVIVAAIMTTYTHSGWPDVVVGLGIAAMNADAAHQVWTAAHDERERSLT